MSSSDAPRFVSRAGEKLDYALERFEIDLGGWVCADLGSNVGGFVDCLLQRGAERVYSVDTGHGVLDWNLRNDDRVVVMEKTNALHVELPELVRLVTIDVAWTRQHLVVPRALEMIEDDGVIVSLIKPHYEAEPGMLKRGVLPRDRVDEVVAGVLDRLGQLGARVACWVESPIEGDKGNLEVLALMRLG